MTQMTDELRQKAYSFMYGGGRTAGGSIIFPDIRAALVDEHGTLNRSLNGSVLEPGTDLFAFAGNEPPAATIKTLLAVIDDQAGMLRRLGQIPRFNEHEFGVEAGYAFDGKWMRARDVLAVITPP